MSLARRERLALVDTMTATGPEAPTLCEGWTARDLAAHLIVRERRPDTAPGILLSRFAEHTERVRREMAKRPWPELLELVRTGPPTLLRPLDGAINATEMFIHHEDVRRGSAGWSPREIGMADERELWTALRRMAKLSYRRSPVTVVLETPDGDHVEVKRPGDRSVVLLGRPSELLLHASGRNAVRLEDERRARRCRRGRRVAARSVGDVRGRRRVARRWRRRRQDSDARRSLATRSRTSSARCGLSTLPRACDVCGGWSPWD